MLFNSPVFLLGYLPVVAIVFFVVARFSVFGAASWLTLASLFFYGWWSPKLVFLLLASVAFNYSAGIAIANARSARQSRILTTIAVSGDLLLLAYFKYLDFMIGALNAVAPVNVPLMHVVLPLGISFFTFTQIAFLVDVHRGLVREHRLLHYVLFVSYFPHLIAGPILHHSEMMPQFANQSTYRFHLEPALDGVMVFLVGLAKKVIIADGLAHFVGPVFSAADAGDHLTFFDAWAASLGYTFQLYFDFSGYSDMAIGLSRIFGIELPLNFASPYKANNIIEFWRRWHMTLSRFLRDYLYIPLGGNRQGKLRRYGNLLLTMALGGLWHGASWTFVAWGTLHGVYLIVCHSWRAMARRLVPATAHRSIPWALDTIAPTLTFVSVVAAWVLFRATTIRGAMSILRGMAGINGFVLPEQLGALVPHLPHFIRLEGRMPLLGNNSVLGVVEQGGLILIAAILCWCFPATQLMSRRLRLLTIFVSFGFVVQAVFFSRAPSPFLYFQF